MLRRDLARALLVLAAAPSLACRGDRRRRGAPTLTVQTSLGGLDGSGTAPEDWVEGPGQVGTLDPASLYEDQLARRLGR